MPRTAKTTGPALSTAETLRRAREIAARREHPKTTLEDIQRALAGSDQLLDEETKAVHPDLSMAEMEGRYRNRRVAVLVTRLEPNGFGGRVFLACGDVDEFEKELMGLRARYPNLSFSKWTFGEVTGGPEGLFV